MPAPILSFFPSHTSTVSITVYNLGSKGQHYRIVLKEHAFPSNIHQTSQHIQHQNSIKQYQKRCKIHLRKLPKLSSSPSVFWPSTSPGLAALLRSFFGFGDVRVSKAQKTLVTRTGEEETNCFWRFLVGLRRLRMHTLV